MNTYILITEEHNAKMLLSLIRTDSMLNDYKFQLHAANSTDPKNFVVEFKTNSPMVSMFDIIGAHSGSAYIFQDITNIQLKI